MMMMVFAWFDYHDPDSGYVVVGTATDFANLEKAKAAERNIQGSDGANWCATQVSPHLENCGSHSHL
jgi:hypothetical protein